MENQQIEQRETVLVTGGTGFIGRWAVASLTQKGHFVHVLARNAQRRESDYLAWIQRHGGEPGRVQLLESDLGLPQLGLSQSQLNRLREVTVIYHMGAAFQWGLDGGEARRITVGGSEALVDVAQGLPRLKRVIHLSGYMIAAQENWSMVGMNPNEPVENPIDPNRLKQLYQKLGAYEAAKIEAHFTVQRLCDAAGIPLTNILLSSVIGHSQTGEIDQPHGVSMLVDQVRTGKLALIPGTKEDWMPLVTIDYLVDFIVGILALENVSGRALNKNLVVLDQATPNFATFVGWLSEGLGRKPPKHHIPKWLLQKVLALGFDRLMGISAETLDFLQPYPFDTGPADALAQQMGLVKPDIRQAVDNMVAFLLEQEQQKGSALYQKV